MNNDVNIINGRGSQALNITSPNVIQIRPEKPQYLPPAFDGIPDELKQLPNWVVWRAEAPHKVGKKWRKMPYTPLAYVPSKYSPDKNSAAPADTADSATWRSYDDAVKAYRDSQRWQRPFDGVGFVFNNAAGPDGLCYCGLDFDEWTDTVQAIIATVATYTEISPSGLGVHAIVRAKPFAQKICKSAALSAEAYSKKRYFTFTGKLVEGAPSNIEARPDEVIEIVAQIAAVHAAEEASRPASERRGKSYLETLNAAGTKMAQSPLLANVSGDYDDLMIPAEPLDVEKLKSALWGLADAWLAAEGNWMMACRICANEAVRDGGGTTPLIQELREALDERSREVEGYDEEENSKRYDRCIAEYGNVKPPILAGSLYKEAEKQGWTWTPVINTADLAGLGGQENVNGGSAASGGNAASLFKPVAVLPLKGSTIYARTYNLLLTLPMPFTHDIMHNKRFYNGDVLSEDLFGRFREICINNLFNNTDPKLEMIRDAAVALCGKNRYDPEADWLRRLAWDGVKRIHLLFIRYGGAEDTPLNREIGRAFMVGKAKRAIEPGCDHDWAPVLEGLQGCGKTTFLRILAGSPDRITDAEIIGKPAQVQQEALLGRTIHEISEMSDIKKADINITKTFMSRTHDRARAAYGRGSEDQPRRCVSAGTTNDATYLQDEVNRRVFPLKVINKMDLEGLRRDRDQLHAEARVALEKGESNTVAEHLWPAAATEQRKRRISDTWEDTLSERLHQEIAANASRGSSTIKAAPQPRFVAEVEVKVQEINYKGQVVWFISSNAVLAGILRVDPNQQRGFEGKRAIKVMERLGWVKQDKTIKVEGIPTRGYIYELASRGIGAGEWGKYRDMLDDEVYPEPQVQPQAEVEPDWTWDYTPPGCVRVGEVFVVIDEEAATLRVINEVSRLFMV